MAGVSFHWQSHKICLAVIPLCPQQGIGCSDFCFQWHKSSLGISRILWQTVFFSVKCVISATKCLCIVFSRYNWWFLSLGCTNVYVNMTISKHIWKTQNNTNYIGNNIQNTEVITPCNHYNGPLTTTPTIATQFQTLQQLKTLAFSITIPPLAAPMDTLPICHPCNHSVSSAFEIVHIPPDTQAPWKTW